MAFATTLKRHTIAQYDSATMLRVTPLRPIIASLLLGALALQFVLAGRGVSCVMPRGSMHSTGVTEHAPATHAMPRPVMVAARVGSDGNTMPMPGSPCDQRGVPVQCVIVAACANAFITTRINRSTAPLPRPVRIVTALVTAAPSPSFPPELPPPRA